MATLNNATSLFLSDCRNRLFPEYSVFDTPIIVYRKSIGDYCAYTSLENACYHEDVDDTRVLFSGHDLQTLRYRRGDVSIEDIHKHIATVANESIS